MGFRAVTALLLALALSAALPAAKAKPAPQAGGKVVVLYLHTHARCISCLKIERYAREAVEARFAAEVKKGKVEFRSVDVQDEGNEHYATDYRIPSKSLVLSRVRGGKELDWKNLSRVWPLLRDEKGFKDYVAGEIRRSLRGL